MLLDKDLARLEHILEAANDAIEIARDRKYSDMFVDRSLRHSLARCLEIVGEAAARVTPEGQQRYPELPWRSMIGMRNIIVHAYFRLNQEIIWATVKDELPPLVPVVEGAIAAETKRLNDERS